MTADDVNTDDELRQRVRLFTLNEDGTWFEKGLGKVIMYQDPDDVLNETNLVVYAESDGSLLLDSKIDPETLYKKEQGRFIIWTEDDNTVLGLSFQESEGCDDIWEMICQVQGKDSSVGVIQVKEEDEDAVDESQDNTVEQDMEFEEMLDFENIVVSSYEREVLSQLIDRVNRLVAPQPMDKFTSPDECQLLDLCTVSEYITETELQTLHEIILYLSSFNQETQ